MDFPSHFTFHHYECACIYLYISLSLDTFIYWIDYTANISKIILSSTKSYAKQRLFHRMPDGSSIVIFSQKPKIESLTRLKFMQHFPFSSQYILQSRSANICWILSSIYIFFHINCYIKCIDIGRNGVTKYGKKNCAGWGMKKVLLRQ